MMTTEPGDTNRHSSSSTTFTSTQHESFLPKQIPAESNSLASQTHHKEASTGPGSRLTVPHTQTNKIWRPAWTECHIGMEVNKDEQCAQSPVANVLVQLQASPSIEWRQYQYEYGYRYDRYGRNNCNGRELINTHQHGTSLGHEDPSSENVQARPMHIDTDPTECHIYNNNSNSNQLPIITKSEVSNYDIQQQQQQQQPQQNHGPQCENGSTTSWDALPTAPAYSYNSNCTASGTSGHSLYRRVSDDPSMYYHTPDTNHNDGYSYYHARPEMNGNGESGDMYSYNQYLNRPPRNHRNHSNHRYQWDNSRPIENGIGCEGQRQMADCRKGGWAYSNERYDPFPPWRPCSPEGLVWDRQPELHITDNTWREHNWPSTAVKNNNGYPLNNNNHDHDHDHNHIPRDQHQSWTPPDDCKGGPFTVTHSHYPSPSPRGGVVGTDHWNARNATCHDNDNPKTMMANCITQSKESNQLSQPLSQLSEPSSHGSINMHQGLYGNGNCNDNGDDDDLGNHSDTGYGNEEQSGQNTLFISTISGRDRPEGPKESRSPLQIATPTSPSFIPVQPKPQQESFAIKVEPSTDTNTNANVNTNISWKDTAIRSKGGGGEGLQRACASTTSTKASRPTPSGKNKPRGNNGNNGCKTKDRQFQKICSRPEKPSMENRKSMPHSHSNQLRSKEKLLTSENNGNENSGRCRRSKVDAKRIEEVGKRTLHSKSPSKDSLNVNNGRESSGTGTDSKTLRGGIKAKGRGKGRLIMSQHGKICKLYSPTHCKAPGTVTLDLSMMMLPDLLVATPYELIREVKQSFASVCQSRGDVSVLMRVLVGIERTSDFVDPSHNYSWSTHLGCIQKLLGLLPMERKGCDYHEITIEDIIRFWAARLVDYGKNSDAS